MIRGFDTLSLWEDAPATRPAYLASCHSVIPTSGVRVEYSDRGSGSAIQTSVHLPRSSGEQIAAFPYDGIAFGATAGPREIASTSTALNTATSAPAASSNTITGSAQLASGSGSAAVATVTNSGAVDVKQRSGLVGILVAAILLSSIVMTI